MKKLIKKFIGYIKKIRREIIFSLNFGQKIKRLHNSNEKVFVCVDSAVHGNMGDQALGFCRLKFLQAIGISKKNILEYTARDRMRFWPQICKAHRESDIIVLRGGGYWGDLWLDGFESILEYIKLFPKNPIIIFPQSVYFSNTEKGREVLELSKKIVGEAQNLTICARDKNSGRLLKEYYPKIKVLTMPDTVLSYKPDIKRKSNELSNKILLCLRNDKEKSISFDVAQELCKIEQDRIIFFQDTSIDFNLKRINQREKNLVKIWNVFLQAKCVVTDRLHGMIFSTILGVPCIVLNNIDGKVENQYEWLKDNLSYVKYVETAAQFQEAYKYIDGCNHTEYPIGNMIPLFKELKECLLSL